MVLGPLVRDLSLLKVGVDPHGRLLERDLV
jgi:hypothetical protein